MHVLKNMMIIVCRGPVTEIQEGGLAMWPAVEETWEDSGVGNSWKPDD
jgi:hypothetical protein